MNAELQGFLSAVGSKTGRKPTKTNDHQYKSRCPAHDDKNPSLSIGFENGKLLLHCHSGCTYESILHAVGMNGHAKHHVDPDRPIKLTGTLEDAVKEIRGEVAGVWKYQNSGGMDIFAAVRVNTQNGKQFLQYRRTENGWINRGLEGLKPLYQLPKLLESPNNTVFIFEGEKCADLGTRLGYISTTSAGGASSANKTDWSPLRGRNVVIFPDNDKAGRKYLRDVCECLSVLRPLPDVRVCELPDLGEGQDVVDYAALAKKAGWSDEELAGNLIEHANESDYVHLRAPLDFIPRPFDASEIRPGPAKRWIWEHYAARGAITLLVGFWKAGKTTLLGHLAKAMESGGSVGRPVSAGKVMVITEESHQSWFDRIQELGIGNWLKVLFADWGRKPTLAEWTKFLDGVHEICRKDKIDLLIIDPASRIMPIRDEKDPVEVGEALLSLNIFKSTNTSVMIVHHTTKAVDINIDTAARGSGEFQAYPEIIVTFRRFDPRKRTDRRRILTISSRFKSPQDDFVIELNEDGSGYVPRGTTREVKSGDTQGMIYEVVTSDPPGMSVTAITEKIAESFGESEAKKKSVEHAVDVMFRDGWLRRSGTGKKGDPYTFWHPGKE